MAQPLHSACGRYVIASNGEIYKYQSLSLELQCEGAALRTTSDIEVILELFVKHGEAALLRLRGMFAFLSWD